MKRIPFVLAAFVVILMSANLAQAGELKKLNPNSVTHLKKCLLIKSQQSDLRMDMITRINESIKTDNAATYESAFHLSEAWTRANWKLHIQCNELIKTLEELE